MADEEQSEIPPRPVFSVQATLELAVQETVEELHGGDPDILEVDYHVTALPQFHLDQDGDLCSALVWQLNLFIYIDVGQENAKRINLAAACPYLACCDGDAKPIQALAKQMWDEFKFLRLLDEDSLDQDLQKVAEGGKE